MEVNIKLGYIKNPKELTNKEKELVSEFIKETTIDIENNVEKMLNDNKNIIKYYADKLYETKIIDGKDFNIDIIL